MVNENPRTSIEKECCGICGGRKHEVRLKFPDRRVLRCLTCRTIFSDLIWDPDRVRQLYETPDFFTGEYYRWDGESALDRLDVSAYTSALLVAKAILGGTGRLLDVGCGLGGFLAQALVMGFGGKGNDTDRVHEDGHSATPRHHHPPRRSSVTRSFGRPIRRRQQLGHPRA